MAVNLVNHWGIHNPIVLSTTMSMCVHSAYFIYPVHPAGHLFNVALVNSFIIPFASIIFDYNSIFAVTTLIMSPGIDFIPMWSGL